MVAPELRLTKKVTADKEGPGPPLPRIVVERVPEVETRRFYVLSADIQAHGHVRKETSAVSSMRVTIVHKNQNTLPPHILGQPCHEVEVCRRKEVSEAKVPWCPFFDNRADTV